MLSGLTEELAHASIESSVANTSAIDAVASIVALTPNAVAATLLAAV